MEIEKLVNEEQGKEYICVKCGDYVSEIFKIDKYELRSSENQTWICPKCIIKAFF